MGRLDNEVRSCAEQQFFHQGRDTGQIPAAVAALEIAGADAAVLTEPGPEPSSQNMDPALPDRRVLVCDPLPDKSQSGERGFEINIEKQPDGVSKGDGMWFTGQQIRNSGGGGGSVDPPASPRAGSCPILEVGLSAHSLSYTQALAMLGL
jgi:hypothetical protein